jgi:hypothetical protein
MPTGYQEKIAFHEQLQRLVSMSPPPPTAALHRWCPHSHCGTIYIIPFYYNQAEAGVMHTLPLPAAAAAEHGCLQDTK